MSIVQLFGENESNCGYCHSERETSISFGIWAHRLTCSDYEMLIKRGWRRSGQYLYKPDLNRTCCPPYTIRLNTDKFELSKSHKRVIKKMRKFLERGRGQDKSMQVDTVSDGKREIIEYQEVKENISIDVQASQPQLHKKQATNHELDVLIEQAEENKPGNKHVLRIDLVPSRFDADTFALYKKYQMSVHKDDPDQVTEQGFTRFLVKSPLIEFTQNGNSYGSFHQKYFIDDKLVACAVLDLLPSGVSSVYFMYDPDFGFLSLGVYSALREIYVARGFAEYYYMGYYIHSCPKMKYKGSYKPSELLCPEQYTWRPLEQVAPHLDQHPLCVFSSDPFRYKIENGTVTQEELGSMRIIVGQKVVPLQILIEHGLLRETEQFKVFYQLAGKELCESLLIVL